MAAVAHRVVLICIDGWGLSDDPHGNAVLNADTPVMDAFQKEAAHAVLDASGLAVGLPDGIMGNSEVGHLTIGAGQAEYQDLVRISLCVKLGNLAEQQAIKDAFARAVNGNGRMHFLGLLSDGSVHSHQDHLYALLEEAKKAGVPNAFVQAFMDGRDTPPDSGAGYLRQLESKIHELSYGSIGTVVGRYYAMDRDKRWERVKLAYEALVRSKDEGSPISTSPSEAVEARYKENEFDEFLKPIIDGDTLLFFDFRSDRMREIVETLGIKPPFETDKHPKDLGVVQFTQYKKDFPLPIVFPPQTLQNVLSEWLSKKGIKQLHVAETEKYAHVTFFFNGGRELQFEGEERVMVPSPKVPTYDKEPKMSAAAVGDEVIKGIQSGKYEFIINNFAPPDMVGHTGVYEATLEAVAETDRVIGRIWDACREHGYSLFVTSDHGNAEKMKTPEGDPITSHSTNPVPFVMAVPGEQVAFSKKDGTLADVAPTILTHMGLDVPSDMTGHSLL
eukprot:jgi/Chlat1/1776/Chrsp134S02114